jgi:hypothetical protein
MDRGSFFLPVLRFLFLIALCLSSGCFSAGALHDSTSGNTQTEGGIDPDGGSGVEDPFPGPFEDPGGTQSGPAEANAEPSVFSTQIGETHDPTGGEDICQVDIVLPLAEIAAEHDDPCPPEKDSLGTPPRVTLSSQDVPGEFSAINDARCTHEGWEFQASVEAIFYHNLRTGEQHPRTFALDVEILQDGVWQPVYSVSFTIPCPWPEPVEECVEDCTQNSSPWKQ